MTSSLRQQILDADDIKTETVYVPEWGVTVLVRGLEAGERNDMVGEARDEQGNTDLNVYYGRIVQVATLDPETREQVFAVDDMPMLRRKAAKAIDRIALTSLRLSGMGKEGGDTVQAAVDAAGKDSSPIPTAASSSPSPIG